MPCAASNTRVLADLLTELTEELMDAHCDTVCLAEALPIGSAWPAHVEYLKDLQRVGQRTLAELSPAASAEPQRSQIAGLRLWRGRKRVLAQLRLPVGQLRRH